MTTLATNNAGISSISFTQSLSEMLFTVSFAQLILNDKHYMLNDCRIPLQRKHAWSNCGYINRNCPQLSYIIGTIDETISYWDMKWELDFKDLRQSPAAIQFIKDCSAWGDEDWSDRAKFLIQWKQVIQFDKFGREVVWSVVNKNHIQRDVYSSKNSIFLYTRSYDKNGNCIAKSNNFDPVR